MDWRRLIGFDMGAPPSRPGSTSGRFDWRPALCSPPILTSAGYAEGMTPKLAEYIAEGRSLSADEREIAALALQQIGAVEQAEVDAAWDEEIDRRVGEILSGKVQLVDGEETRRMARAMLATRRS